MLKFYLYSSIKTCVNDGLSPLQTVISRHWRIEYQVMHKTESIIKNNKLTSSEIIHSFVCHDLDGKRSRMVVL